MTLTFEFDSGRFEMNRPAKYVGQRSFVQKLLSGYKDLKDMHRQTSHTHRSDSSAAIVLPGLLNWSVITPRKTFGKAWLLRENDVCVSVCVWSNWRS